MDDKVITFLCEDSIEGIFSAIYRAWEYGPKISHVRTCNDDTLNFFENYQEVETDMELAEKVRKSVVNKISMEAYYLIFNAALSTAPDKAEAIYQFMRKGFKIGGAVSQNLTDEFVFRVYELSRSVGREAHLYTGFVRFENIGNNILMSKIDPVNNIVPRIMEHFSDRLKQENFIILDVNRKIAAVHANGKEPVITYINEEEYDILMNKADTEPVFKELFNVFFDTIAIKDRVSEKRQRNCMPLRYRKYM